MRLDRRAAGVAAAGVCTFLNLYSTQAILPVLAADFHEGVGRTGLTVTAPLLAVAGMAPFIGSISDMLGRKRLIVTAAMLLVLPTALAAAAPSLNVLILCRFLQGLLLPFIFAVTVAYIGDEVQGADNIRLTGVYTVGTIVGGFCGRMVTGLATQYAGWRWAFVVLAVLTAVAAAAAGLMLPAEQRFRPVRGLGSTLHSFRLHLTNRRLIATYAVGFGVLFSIVTSFTFTNFLMAAPPYRLGPAALGAVFVVYLWGAAVTPFGGRLAVRVGRRAALGVAVALIVAGEALTLLPALPAIIAGLAVACSGMFIEQALSIGFISSAARTAKSTAVGLYVTSYYIGGSLGGILPAGLWQRYGWPGCVALVVLVQLLIAALAMVFWREAAPPQTAI